MAEGGTDSKSIDNQISKIQLEVNECLGNWLVYLQTLNGLCTAGTKLAQSLQTLLSVHDTVSQCRLTGQCLAGWEELTRATYIASNTVKSHVIAALRDHETRDCGGDKHDILRDNLLTFINLQYQFCVACCECLGGMAECSCSQSGTADCDIAALQQCFERLYSSPPPMSSTSTQQLAPNCHRSPLPYPLFPLQVQRRWSETAAAEMSGESSENTMRRWSMPWDCRHVTDWPRPDVRLRLRVPHQDRSRSTTPDTIWKTSTMASPDGLQEAIQLLSCKPGVRPLNQLTAHTSQHIPGLTLTTCNFESNYDSALWPGSRKIGSPRCWPHDSHSSDQSDQSGHRESDHSGEHRDSGKLRPSINPTVIITFIYLQSKAEPAVVKAIARIVFIRIAIIEKSSSVPQTLYRRVKAALQRIHASQRTAVLAPRAPVVGSAPDLSCIRCGAAVICRSLSYRKAMKCKINTRLPKYLTGGKFHGRFT